MHAILAQFDDLDTAIGNSADLPMDRANALRTSLSVVKREAHALLIVPPAEEERVRQAGTQSAAGRGGYLPARRGNS